MCWRRSLFLYFHYPTVAFRLQGGFFKTSHKKYHGAEMMRLCSFYLFFSRVFSNIVLDDSLFLNFGLKTLKENVEIQVQIFKRIIEKMSYFHRYRFKFDVKTLRDSIAPSTINPY